MKNTWNDYEAADRATRAVNQAAYDERMDAANAGLCSFAAAEAGGAVYTRDLAETAAAARAERFAELASPIAAVLDGWLAAFAPQAAPPRITPPRVMPLPVMPRYAEIGNGLFVRVGTGKKRRAA